jgi:choline kinase
MKRTRAAVILAAGLGSRLRPLTDDRPKALMDIGGETILGRAVRLLSEYGVEHIVIATGYREDAVRAAVRNASVRASFCRNERYDSTQNAVSLALCRSAVESEGGWFKLDGDVVFQAEVLTRLDECGAALAVAVDAERDLDAEAMKVECDSSGRVLAFGKQLAVAAARGESIGIERISASGSPIVFSELERAVIDGRTGLYYEDLYSELIQQGRLDAQAVDVGDLPWTEVDTLDDLERARALVLGSASPQRV